MPPACRACVSPGVFPYDENFEKIIAKLPDLRDVRKTQLAKCTVPQLRDICGQAGIPVPDEPTDLIPAILAFQKLEGTRRRATKSAAAPAAAPTAAAAPAAAPAPATTSGTAAAPAAAARGGNRGGAAAAAAAAKRVAQAQPAQALLNPLQSQPYP